MQSKFRLKVEESEWKGQKGVRIFRKEDEALKDNPNFSLFIPVESTEFKEQFLEIIGHLFSPSEIKYLLVYTEVIKGLWNLSQSPP